MTIRIKLFFDDDYEVVTNMVSHGGRLYVTTNAGKVYDASPTIDTHVYNTEGPYPGDEVFSGWPCVGGPRDGETSPGGAYVLDVKNKCWRYAGDPE